MWRFYRNLWLSFYRHYRIFPKDIFFKTNNTPWSNKNRRCYKSRDIKTITLNRFEIDLLRSLKKETGKMFVYWCNLIHFYYAAMAILCTMSARKTFPITIKPISLCYCYVRNNFWGIPNGVVSDFYQHIKLYYTHKQSFSF